MNNSAKNVIEHILLHGDESGFHPTPASEPCQAYPGTLDKLNTLSQRVLNGQELHQEGDLNHHALNNKYNDDEY
jgi:hypothetical protein